MIHSIGSKAALSILPAVLINPGDYVLMTTPGYPVFGTHAKYYGGLVHNLPLTAENKFLPDLDDIPADVLKKAKVLVINYPNNPTGASATPRSNWKRHPSDCANSASFLASPSVRPTRLRMTARCPSP